jgi:DNA-binding transcriptional LysR family regulator
MDIRHLQYFIEVALSGSFTKAAETLRVSQPTISKVVKDMEEELGILLFNRTGKKAELTNEGQMIFNQAKDIVNSFDNLSSALSQATHLVKGKLRIGLPPMAGAGYFPEVIGQFHERYPGIMLELIEYGARKIAEDIENGALDIGVVLLPTKHDVYHSIPIADEKLKLIVHSEHRLAAQTEVSLSELAAEAFIIFREDFSLHERIISACISSGFQPRVVCESSQWDFIGNLVAAKLGIALLPENICRQMNPERIATVSLVQPEIPWKLAFIWRKDVYLSFAAKEWIRFVQTIYPNKEGFLP